MKMLAETLLRIPLVFSSADHSFAAKKMHKNLFVTAGFQYDFTEKQAAACKNFQSQNRRFRIFEADYWKDFQNW